jgi:hypothetical protein
MDTYRTPGRYEIKFAVHYRQAEALRRRIAPFVMLDPHMGPEGFYRIISLYFDSPDLSCFWEKLDGVPFRRKLRMRRYDVAGSRRTFLEIKQRDDHTVQKRRVAGTLDEIMSGLQTLDSTNASLVESGVFQEACYLMRSRHLAPRILVGYNREAYLGLHEPGLRVTLDRNLRYGSFRSDRSDEWQLTNYFFPPPFFVLEVKFNQRVPHWLCSCLNALDLQTSRISKYCHAIDTAEFNSAYL